MDLVSIRDIQGHSFRVTRVLYYPEIVMNGT